MRYNWTYSDLLKVLDRLLPAPLAGQDRQYPLDCEDSLKVHCRSICRLTKSKKGKSAFKLPEGWTIAEKLFATMAVDRFLLEYDDDRSGTFEPLRLVPRDKTVVLGLISSKNPQLENADDIARRIHEASGFFPLENLALSPQCGFASTMEGNLLREEEQWAKSRLVADVARRVWS